MLTAYLTTLIVGTSLLGLSIFTGGDHEMDHDLDGADGNLQLGGDVDMNAEVDANIADDHAGFDFHGLDAWLPIGSLRFWTFFCAFFGLVGTALTLATPLGATMVLLPSVGVGYVSGVSATKIMRTLTGHSIGRVIGAGDLIGVNGTLLLPVAPGKPGKVRMYIGDRCVEEIATSDDSFAAGAAVMVIGTDAEGNIVVSHPTLLNS